MKLHIVDIEEKLDIKLPVKDRKVNIGKDLLVALELDPLLHLKSIVDEIRQGLYPRFAVQFACSGELHHNWRSVGSIFQVGRSLHLKRHLGARYFGYHAFFGADILRELRL